MAREREYWGQRTAATYFTTRVKLCFGCIPPFYEAVRMVLCELKNLQGDRLFELKEVFPLDYGWRKFGLLLLLHAVIRSNRYHLVGGPGRGHISEYSRCQRPSWGFPWSAHGCFQFRSLGSARITRILKLLKFEHGRIRCNVCRWKKTIELLPRQTTIKSGCEWFVLHPASPSPILVLGIAWIWAFFISWNFILLSNVGTIRPFQLQF